MRAKGLDQLKALHEQMQRERDEQSARAARAAEAAARESMQADEFAAAVGPVRALRRHDRAPVARERPAPHPHQRELDERRAMREAVSDEVDLESLLLTDDGLSFRRPGIGPDVPARLRRGQWALQGEIDLHGLTREAARDALAAFVREAHRRGQRCVRVVHGKGHGSPGRRPVLKDKVQRWLAQRSEVIAFAQASAAQGGAGALLVLLAPRNGATR
ncbi:MAG TPA: Smr/MutS family protein [Burkholderiaceae bacterium]|nr:Smr/MutS family protein [Burkholderiaceae bacterium]